MNRSDLGTFYAKNTGLVHEAARKGFARLMEVGMSFTYDDLFQELSEVFIRAFDGYDPNKMKFSTYFMVSAANRVSKMIKRYNIERSNLGLWSIEDMGGGDEDGDAINVEDSLKCPAPTAEEQLIVADELAAMKLSPYATTIVELLIDPPEFLERELEACRAFANYSRNLIKPMKHTYSKAKDSDESGEQKKNQLANVPRVVLPRSSQKIGLSLVCEIIEKAMDVPHSKILAARREVERKFRRLASV